MRKSQILKVIGGRKVLKNQARRSLQGKSQKGSGKRATIDLGTSKGSNRGNDWQAIGEGKKGTRWIWSRISRKGKGYTNPHRERKQKKKEISWICAEGKRNKNYQEAKYKEAKEAIPKESKKNQQKKRKLIDEALETAAEEGKEVEDSRRKKGQLQSQESR